MTPAGAAAFSSAALGSGGAVESPHALTQSSSAQPAMTPRISQVLGIDSVSSLVSPGSNLPLERPAQARRTYTESMATR